MAGPDTGSLYSRILFDRALESRALHQLTSADLPGCRKTLAALVGGLDLDLSGGPARQAVQLLADVLHRVNLEIHRGARHAESYERNRLELIRTFASCRNASAARQQFLPALDRLLEPGRTVLPRSSLVGQAKLFIDGHYPSRLSLSSVAAALNVSPNCLCRAFRREAGMTLTAYIQRVRLEQARALLAEGGCRISEVAYQVGYQNYRDFYRNFVKYEKASPRAVQQRLVRSPRIS